MAHSSAGDRFLIPVGRALMSVIYRVTATGGENFPAGGFLLLPNHISWVDAVVLQIATPRPIRFLIDVDIYHTRFLHSIFRAVGCIPVDQKKPRDALRAACERIRAGEIVCLFPEGQLSRTGILTRLQRGYELIARQAKAPVIPVWLDQLWGSIFSFQGGRFFTKWPRHFPYHVRVAFGKPLASDDADLARVREELLKLGEICYNRRARLRENLARACLRGLKRNFFRTAVIDGMDHSKLSSGKLLAAAIALSRLVRQRCPENRIGIVLPPGKGGVVANLAVMLAGKIPVNLNFTSGRDAVESAKEQAGLKTTISATALANRLEDFPWTPTVLHLDEVLPGMKGTVVLWLAISLVLPTRLLARLLRLPRFGDHAEAVLLFTSGTAGKPKGVALSHRNLVGNVSQFAAMLDATKEDSILASLPFFHTFGMTVTILYPMIEGVRIVTYPSPLEVAKNAALIERYRVTLLLATPTFLRGYLRKADRVQLQSLRLVITGAEKLPNDLAKNFEERFGKEVMQGYGLTETSPVVSVNLPSFAKRGSNHSLQTTSRLGSTGKMAPGIAAEICEPETGAKLSLFETGMLWLRGPNIFEGYLDDPERTAEVLRDGWFKTGDIGRFDEDGFLYIEGRLTRFSKIGGEMVPHEGVEEKINAALGIDAQAERVVAIVGVQDEAKGEALVLLSAVEIDLQKLRADLSSAGVPNLWIPRVVRRIDAIPVLASGKLNLAQCREAATR